MTDDLDLSRELTSIIAATDGVIEIYASGSLAQAVTLDLINLASDEQAEEAKVAVSRAASGIATITATIGVDVGYPVPGTLRNVGDALRLFLRDHDPSGQPPIIDVKVSRIDHDVAVL